MKAATQSPAQDPRHRAMRGLTERDERIARYLRLTGTWDEAEEQLELAAAFREVARQDGVVVDDEALQAGVDLFREDLGLDSVDATLQWLAQTGLALEDVETEVEARLLEDALCAFLDRCHVDDEFRKVRIRFDSVLLRVFVVNDPALGHALVTQQREACDAFHVRGALERCLEQRMEWGWFFREELPERAAARIFKSLPGTLVGPIEIGEDRHAVYGIEAFRQAVLDADIERQIRKELVVERARSIMNPDDPGRFILK